jgi:hypothetical protein
MFFGTTADVRSWRKEDVRREADVSQVPISRERNPDEQRDVWVFPAIPHVAGLSSGAHSRDLAADARLLVLRGAETKFRVRNCRRFHLKSLDHLALLIVFFLRR